MRPHLTRHLFPRLLANQDLLFRCTVRPRLPFNRNHGLTISVLHCPQRRSIFGFSQKKPEKEFRSTNLSPGLIEMMELVTLESMQARPPPAKELKKAFMTFFTSKNRSNQVVTYIEAAHVLRTFRHLRDISKDDQDFGISSLELSLARKVMVRVPQTDKGDAHNEFAREVFAELQRRRMLEWEEFAKLGESFVKSLQFLLKVLVNTGDSMEARTHVEKYWAGRDKPFESLTSNEARRAIDLWGLVMRGFAFEKNEEELLRTFRLAELAGAPFTLRAHQTMVSFYARKDDVVATKAWFDKKPTASQDISIAAPIYSPILYSRILDFCIRNKEIDWCATVFRSLLDSNPQKSDWDEIFKWAAGLLGKGVEDVDRMMTVMVRRNPDNPEIRPDINTINKLVKLVTSLGDHYTAERYIALGKKWGIQPNAATFILQMDYRIEAGDLTGAQIAYEALQGEEIENSEDVPVLNKYIQKLCVAKTIKYDLINKIISDLEERKERLAGDTVIALCVMHLQRDEFHDIVNILQTHCFHHTISERIKTRETFVTFCLDRSNDTQKVWDVYTILKHLFDEIDVETRTQIMNEFFHRQHPEFAIHVFGHMRQHDHPYKRPDISTYVAAFTGFSRPGCASPEFLDTVHNMLKLDSTIEPNTQLYNSLMLAYTAIEEPRRAMEFWEDITNSIEGPTYASLEIIFGSCEILPFGDGPAKSIWSKMRRMEIEVTPRVFAAYVGALAGQGLEEEAKVLIEGMEADVGFGPDVMTLASLYNATPNQTRKDLVEAWAREQYPKVWKEVEALGQRTTPDGWRLFNVVKDVKP